MRSASVRSIARRSAGASLSGIELTARTSRSTSSTTEHDLVGRGLGRRPRERGRLIAERALGPAEDAAEEAEGTTAVGRWARLGLACVEQRALERGQASEPLVLATAPRAEQRTRSDHPLPRRRERPRGCRARSPAGPARPGSSPVGAPVSRRNGGVALPASARETRPAIASAGQRTTTRRRLPSSRVPLSRSGGSAIVRGASPGTQSSSRHATTQRKSTAVLPSPTSWRWTSGPASTSSGPNPATARSDPGSTSPRSTTTVAVAATRSAKLGVAGSQRRRRGERGRGGEDCRRRVSPRRSSAPPGGLARVGPPQERLVDLVLPVAADDDGIEAERLELREEAARGVPRARRGGRAPRAPVSRTRRVPPPAGSAIGTHDRTDVREALLPERVLDHHGHDVPAARAGLEPGRDRRAARGSRTARRGTSRTGAPNACGRGTRARARRCRRVRRIRSRAPAVARSATDPLDRRAAASRRRLPGRRRHSRATRRRPVRQRRSQRSPGSRRGARRAWRATGTASRRPPIDGRRSQTTTTRGASSA